jgi:hypothetical protein
MSHKQSCTIMGLPCEVEFSYYPADDGGRDYPSTPEEYEITAVMVPVMVGKTPTDIDISKHLRDEDYDDLLEQLSHD